MGKVLIRVWLKSIKGAQHHSHMASQIRMAVMVRAATDYMFC